MITKFKIFESSLAFNMGLTSTFDYNFKFPEQIYISSYDKRIRVNWNHHIDGHNMIERMKRYHKADNVPDYITLIIKSISEVIPEIDKKEEKYCIRLMGRNLYILFYVFKGILWDLSRPAIRIITILPNKPEEDYYCMFEVDDTYYLI